MAAQLLCKVHNISLNVFVWNAIQIYIWYLVYVYTHDLTRDTQITQCMWISYVVAGHYFHVLASDDAYTRQWTDPSLTHAIV